MNDLINKSNGKKTEVVLIVGLVFQLFISKYPDAISGNTVDIINIILNSSVLSTLSHRIWRNRSDIWSYIKNVINRLKRVKNDSE